MENYVGIDLGTTNSAICTFDKETQQTRVWKSPEVNDVTPSAIYIDNRGNEFVGQKAYNAAPRSLNNCATLFKPLMGTTTQIELSAVDRSFTPEECSAKVLKTLFGYLPEEIRTSPDMGTVVTVPAAFNQMQKNATFTAAELAGIGKVELVQEPVSAVMSYMKASGGKDGIFLVYDLGGGTLDIAIAESIKKRVAILAHGGIQMCGGRDFDRKIVDNIVRPWLHENFDLPDGLAANPTFKSLLRLSIWATERAKIELSAKDEAMISLSEEEIRTNDLNGEEIYLDIPLDRDTFDELIEEQINETIDAARETLAKTGYTSNDIQCIVWVGGPTHYKPLRDNVAFELGIKGDTLEVNPMTAVAEGASVYAESISWKTEQNKTKQENTSDEPMSQDEFLVTFITMPRTPDDISKIIVRIEGAATSGSEFQVRNLDDGWISRRISLKHGETVEVNLTKPGVNTFEVIAYDGSGNTIKKDKVVIEKTVAEPGDIPASNSVFVEKARRIGGRSIPEYLYREGDSLPLDGTIKLKAGISLEAGSTESLNFKLWEGDIDDYIYDNRPIGYIQINGSDFTEGIIHVDSELKCTYRQIHGANIEFEVEVKIGDNYRKFDNLYHFNNPIPSPLEVAEEGKQLLQRIKHLTELVDDPILKQAREKVEKSIRLDSEESETNTIQKADEDNFVVKKLLFQVRKKHSKLIRQSDLEDVVRYFDEHARKFARSSEASEFDKLVDTAQRAIDNNERNFIEHLDELWSRTWQILWRQDWFIIQQFIRLSKSRHIFEDKDRFDELIHIGMKLLEHPEIKEILDGKRIGTIKSEVVEQLKLIVFQIFEIPRTKGGSHRDIMRDLDTNVS